MKTNKILITSLCLYTLMGLTACGSGGNKAPTKVNSNKGGDNTSNTGNTNVVGNIAGNASSGVTDINLCQLYLYDIDTTKFADAFDNSHKNFMAPDSPITGSAPINTSTISETGNYSFENINIGNYKLILNCLVGQDVQDESQLIDDPIQYDGYIIPNLAGIKPNTLTISVTENTTTQADFIDTNVKPLVDEKADVIVQVDVDDVSSHKENLHDIWGTINRIAPKNGVTTIDGLKVNTVRMLGGINKKVGGINVSDLDYDTASYNEQTQQYEYNFKPLIDRINAIIDKGKNLHQIVLDQPPWAFQTGYTFIPDDQKDGVHFREKERVSHYGNSLPPKDKAAYNQFLQATINHLVINYGKELVQSWRFRIGTEIETPDHWFGTEQDFIEHFANSVNAIRKVLPEAKIGLHTRAPNFNYKNGTVTNYKSEPIKSFANAIIEYCYDNNIKYDFWGLSDYPFITRADTRDPKTKFDQFFKTLVTHPKWQHDTIIDFEEYSVITKMGGVPDYAYITSNSPQADTFNIALTDELYQHKINQVFQWGLRDGDKPWPVEAFATMFGQPRIQTEIRNQDNGLVDNIGSIVVKDPSDNTIQAITYHYAPQDLEATNDRNVTLSFNTNIAVGTTFHYRKKLAAPAHHAFHNFMKHASAPSWLKSGNIYNKYGSPNIVLNETGKAQWDSYQHNNPSAWTQWQKEKTVARSDGKSGSTVNISSLLPLFSFEKTEIKWND